MWVLRTVIKADALPARGDSHVRALVRGLPAEPASQRGVMAERGTPVDHATAHRWAADNLHASKIPFRRVDTVLSMVHRFRVANCGPVLDSHFGENLRARLVDPAHRKTTRAPQQITFSSFPLPVSDLPRLPFTGARPKN